MFRKLSMHLKSVNRLLKWVRKSPEIMNKRHRTLIEAER